MPQIVEGWMSAAEIAWLKSQAANRNAVAEVGCWMGLTTREIADSGAGKVYAVDTWEGSEEHKKALADKPDDWLFQKFISNIGERQNIIPLQMPSVEAANFLADKGVKLDMVFIDAAHDYANVKADIIAWMPLLRPGGLLSGHDFDAGRAGVVKAVREIVGEPKRAAGSIWYAG